MKFTAFLLLCFLSSLSAHFETCKRKWKKLGCFNDKLKLNRALSEELVNRRDVTNPNYDGHNIDWKNFPASLHSLYCKCAEEAEKKGFTHFGLQFYGECWGGSLAVERFNIHGKMKKCIGVDYKPCNDSSPTECVGGQLGNYIYHLEERVVKAADLPIINGGYSLWSPWSECSKTCGGGTRLRNRACKEPEPLNGGQDCTELGPSDETQLCNPNPCKKSCRKAIDLGIIMDASSSVRRRNYLKMKLFIRALADDFGVSVSGTHFGILHYSSYARLDFRPNDSRYHNIASLKAKINSIVYSYGGTRTDKALRLAEREFFCDSCRRDGVPQVLLVITDGNTNIGSEDLGIASIGMKESGVTILSLGVGKGISMSELLLIASEPKAKHAFQLSNFDQLKSKINVILENACGVI